MIKIILFLLSLFTANIFATEQTVTNTTPINIDREVMADSTYEQKESVICVHAFLRSYRSLKHIGHTLEKDNFDVFIWNYETRKFTLERHAEHLIKVLKKIAELKPGVPINFVTHSIGGVIVRVTLSHPECPEEAKMGKIVMMAPPNAGSDLARRYQNNKPIKFIFGGKLGRQLMTYSPQQMLNIAKIPENVHVLVLNGNKRSRFAPFYLDGENDGKVKVAETSLNTPHQSYTIATNHTHIITNSKSIYITKEFLKLGYKSPSLKNTVKNHENPLSKLKFGSYSKDIYIIHCLGSNPYSVKGIPHTIKRKNS